MKIHKIPCGYRFVGMADDFSEAEMAWFRKPLGR